MFKLTSFLLRGNSVQYKYRHKLSVHTLSREVTQGNLNTRLNHAQNQQFHCPHTKATIYIKIYLNSNKLHSIISIFTHLSVHTIRNVAYIRNYK